MDSMQDLPLLSLEFYLEGQSHSPRKLLQSLGRNPHLPLSLSSINILDPQVKQSLVRNVSGDETASIFQPLLALTNLQMLRLECAAVELLDDVWLNRASKRFPQLQALIVHGRALERKRITLAGYVPLIQNCPRLSQISLATACRSFDSRKALPAGLCNENVTRLDCSESSIWSPVGSIFRCLILMFPNLILLSTPHPVPSEERESWIELRRLVCEGQMY